MPRLNPIVKEALGRARADIREAAKKRLGREYAADRVNEAAHRLLASDKGEKYWRLALGAIDGASWTDLEEAQRVFAAPPKPAVKKRPRSFADLATAPPRVSAKRDHPLFADIGAPKISADDLKELGI